MPTGHPCGDVKQPVGYTSLGVKPQADESHLGVMIKEMAAGAAEKRWGHADGQGLGSGFTPLFIVQGKRSSAKPAERAAGEMGGTAVWLPGG